MIARSVAGSSALVGSSSKRIGEFFRNARAMPMRLALPDAEVTAALADRTVEALRQPPDELRRLRTLGRLYDLLPQSRPAAHRRCSRGSWWRKAGCLATLG